MPYSINEGSCETAEGKGGQYAVVKDDDGTQMGCHMTRDAALRQIAALEASEEIKILPESYREAEVEGINCSTCKHFEAGYCDKWDEEVDPAFVCDAYEAYDDMEVKAKVSAPQSVRNNFRRGLELHEEGLSGSGLEPATVAMARNIAGGGTIGEAQIRKGNRWWGRNERFLDEPKDSPAYVSALLWGGAAGRDWYRSLYRQLEAGTLKDVNMEDVLVSFGDAIKVISETDDTVTIGGYLVRYGNPVDTDLEGDYFTPDTYFGENTKATVVYHHGMDAKMGARRLGTGELKRDDAGLWMEAQLKMRDEYEKYIAEMVKQGKLGYSSGAVGHLVERTPTGKANRIDTWIIGEASITPTPAEPRNIVSLKSLFAGTEGDVQESIKTEDVQGTEESVTDTDTNLSDFTAMENNTQKAADQIVVPTLDQISAVMDEKLKAFSPAKQEGKTIDPAFNVNVKTKRGDDETKAFAYFVRTGDKGAIKASNDTDMNVGTAADGGNAVPTGHFQGIIARRDESMLAQRLGVRNIPGQGTTVNVPLDNEGDGEFVSTNETANFDRDAPALDQAAMTLVKYTKKIELSVELLEDEDSRLLEFLNDFVGRGMAKTHNNLLITEVGSNGTSLKTFNSATAVAAGEIEDLMSFGDLPYYLDEGNSNAFIMRPSTLMDIYSIRGAERAYHAQVGDTANTLMGYPVYFSQKTGATNTASSKSVYFGNFNYVGFREAPGFTVLRDPYSKAGSGQVVLHYYFRTVYKVLQAEAVGYGVHPSA